MRGLALLALFLGVLLAASVALVARGLGRFETWEPIAFRFENPTLAVGRGERVVVKPIERGGTWQRFTFTAVVGEPEALKDAAFPLPYAAAALETRWSEEGWRYDPSDFVRALPLQGMGAPPREWLTEIRPVLEVAPDGSSRLVYRAAYLHETGMRVFYVHDPARKIPGFGWVRQERYAKDQEQPAIFFAYPDAPAEDLAEGPK